MGVSKVILNNETLMDVTDTTVDEDNLLSGETALGADGETVRGSVTVPTKTSDLTNDSGFISTETDPTVPSWAKASNKPTYTASEVGALSDSTDVTKWNGVALNTSYYSAQTSIEVPIFVAGAAYRYTGNVTPAAGKIALWDSDKYLYSMTPSASDNSTKVATTAYVDNAVSSVDALPSQSGQSGKFLTTNGSAASWASVTVPTKTSDLTNDSGFISAETDPTVPSWAKQSSKPTYTASEVGALPDSTDVTEWNGVSLAKQSSTYGGDNTYVPATNTLSPLNMSFTKYTYTPTANAIAKYDKNSYLYSTTPSASDNSTKVATTAYVDNAISSVDALPSQSGQSGKFLTTDGTDASWGTVTVPTKTSDLTNDSGFITGYTETDPTVPSWAKASSKPTYTASEVGAAASLHNHDAGDINSGTLSVARGGTGASSFTANSVVVSGSSTTAALTTRAITNNTLASASIAGSTNIPTMNTLKNALNRETGVSAADTNYSTYMARGEAIMNSAPTSGYNGTITWIYS